MINEYIGGASIATRVSIVKALNDNINNFYVGGSYNKDDCTDSFFFPNSNLVPIPVPIKKIVDGIQINNRISMQFLNKIMFKKNNIYPIVANSTINKELDFDYYSCTIDDTKIKECLYFSVKVPRKYLDKSEIGNIITCITLNDKGKKIDEKEIILDIQDEKDIAFYTWEIRKPKRDFMYKIKFNFNDDMKNKIQQDKSTVTKK
ncbi:MAG: hypothetical protein FWF46_00425 [Oscillospiraceae bacterium]|nr:hypothetical protein [Oscillospiraceae bacterium]